MNNKNFILHQFKHKLQWFILCVFLLSANLNAQQVFNEASVNCGGFVDPAATNLQTIQSQLATCMLANDIKEQEGGTLDDFCKLQELLITLKQEAKNIYEIKTDVVRKEMVDLIEANKGEPSYSNAQAILSKVYNYKYSEFIALPNANSSASGSRLFNVNEETEQLEEVVKTFKLFPNPSSGNTTISFISKEKVNIAEVYVYDITGKLIIKQNMVINSSSNIIETEDLYPGLYLVNLLIDGKVVGKQKLIKQ